MTCDTWPVHSPGAIQPFGYLLAIDANTSRLTHWSANTPGGKASPSEDSFPEALFAPEAIGDLRRLCTQHGTQRLLLRNGEQVRGLAHENAQGRLILELETVQPSSPDALIRQQESVSAFAASLEELKDPLAVCDAAAVAIKALTGYDRVMIYRFHADLHGEVIAEAREQELETWLGLHYPATDIPEPARAVFAATRLRLIPDVAYTAVPIVAPPDCREPLDLTRSVLRSVAPIHIEYLQNMRVTASLTLSIKTGGALWGLVACHHYSGPKYPDASLRDACSIISDYLSAAIALKSEQQTFAARRAKAAVESALRDQLAIAPSIAEGLCSGSRTVLELLSDECAGAAVMAGGAIKCIGRTPSQAQVRNLVEWLRTQTAEPVYATDRLGDVYPEASAFAAPAAGVLALLPSAQTDSAVMWFKPETIDTVTWGGNPEKAIDISSMRIHPRRSFEAWTQTVRGRSRPWHPWEIEAASSFLLTLAQDELRRRVESEAQARTEAERANQTKQEFIAVVSHDLRDPLSSLSLSLVVLKKLLPAESRETAAPTLGSMDRAVAQISSLVKALLELSVIEAGRLKLSLQPTSAVQVLQDCVDVLFPLAAEKNVRLVLRAPPDASMVEADRDQLLQVCSNLIGNAIKFTPEGGAIEVRLRDAARAVAVEIEDSGPGISPEDLPHVFDQFYRAREAKTRGVGLGLAIAKGIIDAHGGRIGVRSQLGKGTTFWFTLPKTS